MLFGFFTANLYAAKHDLCRELAERTLTLAEKQKALVPLVVGHRMMAITLLLSGAIEQSRKHFDQALTLYDPVEHRSQAIRFGFDPRVVILGVRSRALWLLGHPNRGLADAEDALNGARAAGHAPTLLVALVSIEKIYLFSGNHTAASAALNELGALADEKGASAWKTGETAGRGRLFALTGDPSGAVQKLTSGLADAAQRATGNTLDQPFNLCCLAHLTPSSANSTRLSAELAKL